MRRRPRTGRSTLVCPQCGSAKILQIAGTITGAVYHCRACNYQGALVLEIDLPAPGDPPA